MGRLQSSIGLITGIPIADTIQQLLAISAQPRNRLIERTDQLRSQQVAVNSLAAGVIGVQFAGARLGDSALFQQKAATSSNEAVLGGTITGNPAAGSYQFTPIRQVQSHQLLSNGLASRSDGLGGGEVALRFGGYVDQGMALEDLNGGLGVQRGKIRITDRSGATAEIDLNVAQTIDDVLSEINDNGIINVSAEAAGDRIKLIDNTGQTTANLQVRDFGSTTTATDLGLASINVAAAEAFGSDVVSLSNGLSLDRLNDGNGVSFQEGAADLKVDLRDGSSLQFEFLAQTKGATVSTATTDAANGPDAAVTITSVGSGATYDGYEIHFVDDENIAAGNETVEVDTVAKTITFSIDAGQTRSADIVQTLNEDTTANQLFTATVASGGNGTGVVDVADTATTAGGAIEYNDESTVGELLATFNSLDPTKLKAQISATGDGIELVDLTAGGNTFSVSNLFGGSLAEDLGFTDVAVGGVITGERRFAGLKTVLLDRLKGGVGIGALGTLSLTDRSGAAGNVDLSSAKTLDDVMAAINASSVGIQAKINQTRNGLTLSDTSGGTGNLIVANGDATNSADALDVAINSAVATVNSGSLDLQTFHERISLDTLNNGRGVGTGSFLITDTAGQVEAVNVAASGAETVGDVIDLINGLSIGVEARINATGDGIAIVDTASGIGKITIADEGSGTAAADLKIAGTSSSQLIGSTPTEVIDGSTTIRITLAAGDSLDDLVDKINAFDGDISASVFDGGSGTKPFRLSLVSQVEGASGALLVDMSQLGISYDQVAAAQDALLLVGSPGGTGSGGMISSTSNSFDGLIEGINLTISGTSDEAITIEVEQTNEGVISQVELLVSQFNKLHETLAELTFFDETTNDKGLLIGSSSVLRIEYDLANVLSSRFYSAGSTLSLQQLGVRIGDDGTLSFDKTKFDERYAADSNAVEKFFTQEGTGLAARSNTVSEQLAGATNSVLINRSQALQQSIESNSERISALTAALAREEESLTLEFFRLEEAIARLQANSTSIASIQPITRLFNQ